ncbi:MAG TPA: CsgG/HfaB family protein [Candidatus Manganitrophaceae bacterium]|nr:CsgG/HfaB family protein [Candidatus Manganitrophaceae bacterium]
MTDRKFLTFFFLSLLLIQGQLWISPSAAKGEEDASSETLKHLYQAGRYKEGIDRMAGKKIESSEEALYLGLSHLRLGNQAGAIEAWKQYLRMEEGSEGARDLSRYLTLLLQEEAKRTARRIIRQEKSLSEKVDVRTIAVSPFQNLGKQTYAPLSKGLAEMVITDLSKVKTLKVVERIQLQAILNELKLSQSGLVDKKSAPRVGKLLGAGKIATGSFLDVGEEKLRLDAAVTETEKGKLLASPEVTGGLSNFFQLEKALVFKILCGIGQCPESLDSETKTSVEKIHTRNLKAFRLYSEGLDLLDQGNYREASRSFFLAVEEDPEFNLARKALLEAPLFPLDLSAMIASAESIGRGEKGSFTAPVALTPPSLPERGSGIQAMAPALEILTPAASPSSAGAPATVPVTIGVQFK